MVRSFWKKNNTSIHGTSSLEEVLQQASKSDDFIHYSLSEHKNGVVLSYYQSLVDEEKINRYVLPPLQISNNQIIHLEELIQLIPIEDIQIYSDPVEVELKLTQGYISVQLNNDHGKAALINVQNPKRGLRTNNDTENEFSVVGPKVGFLEDITTNMNLLRRKIVTSNLIFEEITVGSVSKTKVMIAYIEGITNIEHVNTARQRLQDVDFDVIFDSSVLDQLISDNSNSPFPLFLSSERIDRVVYALISGQVAILSDGSPYIITGPSTIFDFFISPEDYYLPWIVGSFFRLVRFFGVFFSIFASPIYVAVVTFHYVIVPVDLLGPLIESRMDVPFPPIIEVLFLEITIELLREAGARLPTKVGQTLGIVGGIVIGQAAVAAALTSNILLIIVALSALASFTTPIFKMSNTIRLLRFPFIVFAAIWGGLGIVFALTILLTHLLRLKSLGTPYMAPLFPFRIKQFADSFIRSSLSITNKRPGYLRPQLRTRYRVKQGKDDYDNE